MRINVVLRYIGLVLLFEAAFMLLSAVISYFNGVDSGFAPLLLSFLFTTILGCFPLIFVGSTDKISSKESYAIVIGAWLMSCFVGMLPYLLWGGEFSVINAWFESVSGFTTTGATILNNIEALPKSLLFWRSATNWIGGIGVVMFALVVIPMMGRSKMSVSSVEISSMAKDNYRYRSQKIIQILLIVYVGITVLETVLLQLAGMSLFDAVNHSFATVATGGFSTRNASIGAYHNVWIEIITTFFMFVSGMHFGVIYATLTGRHNNIFRTEVCRLYIISTVAFCLIMALNLWLSHTYGTFWESLRYGTFQGVSIGTTTGFGTADSNLWPALSVCILIYMSIQGSTAGSTAGGMKIDRVLLTAKVIKARLKLQQHPNAIIRIKNNGIVQEDSLVHFAVLYIVIYLSIILFGTLVNAAYGVDTLTSFTAAVTSMGNTGPGFGQVGACSTFSALPAMVKFCSSILMLLGRLEIFGLLQFFLIKWWV